MIRGTAQSFKFILPCANNELQWATIQFWQSNNLSKKLPITKRLNNCGPRNDSGSLDGSKVLYISLTAEETARFSDKYKVKLQMRAQPQVGVPFGCKPQLITVYPMPDDIIEEDVQLPSVDNDGWVILDGESILANEEDLTMLNENGIIG